jgi:hypothetical protein
MRLEKSEKIPKNPTDNKKPRKNLKTDVAYK